MKTNRINFTVPGALCKALPFLLVLAAYFRATEAVAQNTHRAELRSASIQYFSAPVVNTPGANPFTIEAWVKTSGLNEQIVCAANNGTRIVLSFHVDAAGKLSSEVAWIDGSNQQVTVTGSKAINDTAWHHVAMVTENVAG